MNAKVPAHHLDASLIRKMTDSAADAASGVVAHLSTQDTSVAARGREFVLNFDNDGFYIGTVSDSGSEDDSDHDLDATNLGDDGGGSAVAGSSPPRRSTRWVTRDSLMLASMITMVGVFAAAELIGGFASNSLALVADASHMVSDLLSLSVGLVAMILAGRAETSRHSYGWQRAEVIGALSNGVFLVSICVFNVINAVVRIVAPERVDYPWVVFGVGVGGLVVNVVGLLMFCSHRSLHAHHHHGHGHDTEHHHHGNVNLHGVFLHILGDALGSLIVIATAIVYLVWPLTAEEAASRAHWQLYVDPVSTICFSAFILKSAIPLLRTTVRVLMQATPANVDKLLLRRTIESVAGVESVHELHVWQMGPGYAIGTVHVRCNTTDDYRAACRTIKSIFHANHVHRTTVQLEFCEHGVRGDDGRDSCCHTPHRHSASCCTPVHSNKSSDSSSTIVDD